MKLIIDIPDEEHICLPDAIRMAVRNSTPIPETYIAYGTPVPDKEGYWIKRQNYSIPEGYVFICSNCHLGIRDSLTIRNYCPCCGAKMGKEKQDD